MPPSESTLASNNPFRRKTPADPSPAAAVEISPRPPFTTFKSAVSRVERDAENDSPVQTKPKKIVKKVRVQSPPPSSPEDAVPVRGYPGGIDYDDDDDGGYSDDSDPRGRDDNIDPFSNAPADLSDTSDFTMQRPRTNLFPSQPHSTSDENTGDSDNPQNPTNSKGAMDVNAFKQLLLTGQADAPRFGSPAADNDATSTEEAERGSGNDKAAADVHAAKRKSILDAMQETARSLNQTRAPDTSLGRSSSTAKKPPPPPPSSRHGKLIKIELGADEQPAGQLNNAAAIEPNPAAVEQPLRPSSSDTNKPLPVRPLEDDEAESIFDREAAGKIPEGFANIQAHPRPPTPPPGLRQRSESQGSTQSARSKAAPAAPPPRRPGRTDSKVASDSQNAEEDPPRSSLDSSRSSIRINLSAPAPPPPRRPQHNRSGSSFTAAGGNSHASSVAPSTPNEQSPAGVGFSHMTPNSQQSDGMATVTTGKDGQTRISPPPPPPARHSSTRRPPSVHSIDLGGGGASSPSSSIRKVSREKDGATIAPPPPPPSRRRGGSRGNTETSSSSTYQPGGAGSNITSTPVLEEGPQGREILADLDALQREVDALRSRYAA